MKTMEKKPDIYERKVIAREEQKEKIEIFSDKDISEANNLLKRRESKESPFTNEEKKTLMELMTKRENEIRRILPYFSFETIAELTGTREESSKQFEAADRYFERTAKMGKTPPNAHGIPRDLYNAALYLEKLKTWDKEPKEIENNFPYTYKERQKLYRDKHEKVTALRGGHRFSETKRDELLTKLESGNISPESEEMEILVGIANKEKLVLEAKIPDYLREAVIYMPKLAEEVQRFPHKFFWLKGKEKGPLKDSIATHRKRIEKFRNSNI